VLLSLVSLLRFCKCVPFDRWEEIGGGGGGGS